MSIPSTFRARDPYVPVLCTKISSMIYAYFMRNIEEVRGINHICVLKEGVMPQFLGVIFFSIHCKFGIKQSFYYKGI